MPFTDLPTNDQIYTATIIREHFFLLSLSSDWLSTAKALYGPFFA